MEVYGSGTELSLQSTSIDENLTILRKKSANTLTQISQKLDKKISFVKSMTETAFLKEHVSFLPEIP